MRNFFLNQFYTNMRGGQRNLNLILDNIYPVGSIHLTIGDYNPSQYFGGNWQKISGGFLWGCNTSIDDNLMSASTGHTKSFDTTLTVNQIPAHKHTLGFTGTSADVGTPHYHNYGEGLAFGINNQRKYNRNDMIDNTGGGKGHSHAIPHIGVWVWKRIS